ncbi:hypothetical protein [Serratia sp. UGAL515B_01]|uniref:hypothetical protein n=1 Tax=Serratia sp. UGAL515B_01 TaxID=2986763 RepID=UPI002954CA3D|nr:hypothetical protein [Serratia sp. UGAL515B_01]WON76957.1 hypothetical protein OK023_17580 [Serratia sp. UGAL515B_01]
MKKNNGISLIEASLAIFLTTLLFIFGRSIYSSVEDYKKYITVSTQIIKILNDVNFFVSREKNINKFKFKDDTCIFAPDEDFLRKNNIIGKDYHNTTVMAQKLNVYIRVPECNTEDFNSKKFNYEILVTAKGSLNQYSSSSISAMMNIIGGVKAGDENTYIGLFRRNIINLSDWKIDNKKIGLIGYQYHHHDDKKGVLINDLSLIPYEDGKPVEQNKSIWNPRYNDKLIVLWSGVNMYQSTITLTINKNNNKIFSQSVQMLTDSAKNKYTFYFPQHWLQGLKINELYDLEIKIQGEDENGNDVDSDKSLYVFKTIPLKIKNKKP